MKNVVSSTRFPRDPMNIQQNNEKCVSIVQLVHIVQWPEVVAAGGRL